MKQLIGKAAPYVAIVLSISLVSGCSLFGSETASTDVKEEKPVVEQNVTEQDTATETEVVEESTEETEVEETSSDEAIVEEDTDTGSLANTSIIDVITPSSNKPSTIVASKPVSKPKAPSSGTVVTKPSAPSVPTAPVVTKPKPQEPTSPPVVTQPAPQEPTNPPVVTEPTPEEPVTPPVVTEPTEPAPTVPAPTEPTEPAPTVPAPTEPTEPAPSEPAPTEPAPEQPADPADGDAAFKSLIDDVYASFQADTSWQSESNLLIDLLNQHRQDNGLGTVAYNEELTKFAAFRWNDLTENQYYSHDSATYGTFAEMTQKAGLDKNYVTGENLTITFTGAQEAFDQLKASAGHNQNMLGYYDQVGIVVKGEMAVMVLGRRIN